MLVCCATALFLSDMPCSGGSVPAAPEPSYRVVNPGAAAINSPANFNSVAVISDVHGMYTPLFSLLRAGGVIDYAGNWAAGRTLLIIIGDSIDKGDNSVDTLDLWMQLSAQAPRYGGRVIHLLGNHEAEFLADPKNSEIAKDFRKELKARNIKLKEYTSPGHTRADFLLAMPAAVKVGKWLFCHSGLMPDMTWAEFARNAADSLQTGDYSAPILSGDDSILAAKGWWAAPAGRQALEERLSTAGMYGVVFGHQPKALDVEGASAVTADRRIVKIDNGMSPEAGSNPGTLLVFPVPAEMERSGPARMQTISQSGITKPLLPR